MYATIEPKRAATPINLLKNTINTQSPGPTTLNPTINHVDHESVNVSSKEAEGHDTALENKSVKVETVTYPPLGEGVLGLAKNEGAPVQAVNPIANVLSDIAALK